MMRNVEILKFTGKSRIKRNQTKRRFKNLIFFFYANKYNENEICMLPMQN